MIMAIVIGLLAGFIFSIPAGPVSVMIFKNSSLYGFKSGLATVLGMITAEIIYITLYFLGLYAFLKENVSVNSLISLSGGVLISYLGIKGFFKKKAINGEGTERSNFKNYLKAFFVTLFNPAILLFFITLTSMYLSSGYGSNSIINQVFLFSSTEIGTFIWFIFVIFLTLKLSEKFNIFMKRFVEPFASCLLVCFGGYILFKNLMM